MKPRARRITITTALLGAGVLAILVLAHWRTVCDHVEAWHFQLTRETKMIEPARAEWWPRYSLELEQSPAMVSLQTFLDLLGGYSAYPVIYAPQESYQLARLPETMTAETARMTLESNGYRVLEQRFPRRAYVVIRDESVGSAPRR